MRLPRTRPGAEALAAAFLTSDAWTLDALRMHAADAFAISPRAAWLGRAAKRALAAFDGPPRARFRDLVATAGALASWLGITPAELMWFADPRALERLPSAAEPLRHYRYAWVPKPSGGLRLLEAPKPRLKQIQRRILAGILDVVPPHDAAHGFRAARSPRSHAAIHAGSSIVVRVDLADFFLSISSAHVRAIFAALGYPSETSWLLGCLATNIAPVVPHAIAAAAGAGARYSRYADDLVFSGDASFARVAWRWTRFVETIVREEGFVVNRAKTRLMRRGSRQVVTGVVVNETPTIARAEVERLEAILYNCVGHGPGSQNREDHPSFRAHLRGKIAHVKSVAPARAERLEELFARIAWDEPGLTRT